MGRFIRTIIVSVTILALIGFAGCDIAQNTVVKELKSPNGKYTAVAFIRDAGATTPFSPQVTIVKGAKSFKNESGNIFIGNHSENIDIEWEDNNTLIVYYSCSEENVFKKITKFDEVTIKYNTIKFRKN